MILHKGFDLRPSLDQCSNPSTCVCVCVMCAQCCQLCVYLRLTAMPPSTETQTVRIRSITHFASCPLLPLSDIKYHSLLHLSTVKLNFKVFHLPNPAAYSGSHSWWCCGRGKRSQKEVSVIGESQRGRVAFQSRLSFPENASFGCRRARRTR